MSINDLVWESVEIKRHPAVYKLISETGEILYIGQSQCPIPRIRQHIKDGRIPFSQCEIAMVEEGQDLDRIEKELIEFHEPEFNYTHTQKPHRPRGPLAPWQLCSVEEIGLAFVHRATKKHVSVDVYMAMSYPDRAKLQLPVDFKI